MRRKKQCEWLKAQVTMSDLVCKMIACSYCDRDGNLRRLKRDFESYELHDTPA
jgi:hypothetical protein